MVELFTRRHRLDDLLFAKKKIVPQNIDTNKKLQRQKISMKLEGKSSWYFAKVLLDLNGEIIEGKLKYEFLKVLQEKKLFVVVPTRCL